MTLPIVNSTLLAIIVLLSLVLILSIERQYCYVDSWRRSKR